MDDDNADYLVTGTGKTVEEAKRVFIGGYEDMKRICKEDGRKFQERQFEFVYDMASFLEYYRKVFSLAGLSRITGVNQQQLSHYVTGRRRPSKKTVSKMNSAIHSFANDLSTVQFV